MTWLDISVSISPGQKYLCKFSDDCAEISRINADSNEDLLSK